MRASVRACVRACVRTEIYIHYIKRPSTLLDGWMNERMDRWIHCWMGVWIGRWIVGDEDMA